MTDASLPPRLLGVVLGKTVDKVVIVGPVDVDCMTCLVTGVTTRIGWRDPSGIVHRVRWRVRGGCYKLCDFQDGDIMRKDAKVIDVDRLISVEEP